MSDTRVPLRPWGALALFGLFGLFGASCGNAFSGADSKGGTGGTGHGRGGGTATGGTDSIGGAGGDAAGEGALGGTAGNARGGSAGFSVGGGATGGSATGGGSASGGSGAAGGSDGGGAQPDCLLTSAQGLNSGATVSFIARSTGENVGGKWLPLPRADTSAIVCAPAGDGTYRLLWQSPTGAILSTLDASGEVTGSRDMAYMAGWAPRGYAKKPDGTARLLWMTGSSDGHGLGALVPLTSSDEVDSNGAVKMFDRAPTCTSALCRTWPINYSVVSDGTARLLFNNGEVWALTRADEPTARTFTPGRSSTRDSMVFNWGTTSYAVAADGTTFIAFTYSDPLSAYNQALVCQYAREDDTTAAMVPDTDGWGPGFCKRYPLPQGDNAGRTVVAGFGLAPD